MDTDAIRLEAADNVATVLRPVAAGESIRVACGADVRLLPAIDAIPMCHKISLLPIAQGQAVVKYGQAIGLASAPVEAGRHVHVHNLRSARAGGAS
ncbi:UxaA family hydrolase [Roseomonas sp. OT10]|uniref:UxaA family hydrolase n=1 Tax=Roseomonas cutis TaxID=2897332 RepID=UPI001E3A3A61|nr:UxaA family hydrolase [Roseomonas sp. OT10]UFN48455.1 UxaA family hydrolase [Roseomonas sp. OT10]